MSTARRMRTWGTQRVSMTGLVNRQQSKYWLNAYQLGVKDFFGQLPFLGKLDPAGGLKRFTPNYRGTNSALLLAMGISGSISGTVAENGVAIVNCVVLLLLRSDGRLIGRTYTDSSGAFSFANLDTSSNDYVVIALDPDGGATYNALVYDRVTPV